MASDKGEVRIETRGALNVIRWYEGSTSGGGVFVQLLSRDGSVLLAQGDTGLLGAARAFRLVADALRRELNVPQGWYLLSDGIADGPRPPEVPSVAADETEGSDES